MIRRRSPVFEIPALLMAVILVGTSVTLAQNRQRDVFGGYTSTQIVVKLWPESVATPAARRHFRIAPRDADPRAALSGPVQTAAENWRTTRMRPAYSEPFADPAVASRHGLDRTFIIEVPEGTDTEAMAAAFAGLGADIEIAAVDGIGGVADVIPNDTNFNLQYAMHNTGQTGGTADADIDAPAAWALHSGDLGTVTIAIIDSGVTPHLDFGTRLIPGRNTNNPLTPTLTTDGCPHGTHVAGIAAATGNNGVGVAGVTWGAYIMPVRVLNECNGLVSQLADGIVWAADNGADVGNMSLQYYGLSLSEYNLLSDAINYAHDLGMILIAAAGNTNLGPPDRTYVAYPARLPGCMGVSATDNRDNLASFSRYGNKVDVCAPGDDIYSTWTSNGYTFLFGTSMATPHVSGLAALIKSYVPALTNVDIELILDNSADDLGPGGWDDHYGFGRINAYNALLRANMWQQVGACCIDAQVNCVDALTAQECADQFGRYGGDGSTCAMVVFNPPCPVCNGPKDCDDGSPCTADVCNPNGTCSNPLEPSTTVCRPSIGACDPAEVCDGMNPDCPADLLSFGNECRVSAGVCDPAEACDGMSAVCPPDLLSSGNVCRPSAGVCDPAEVCDGMNPDCPADLLSLGNECRASAGVCDPVEACDGMSAACPPDLLSSGNACRPAVDECDAAEVCDGTSAGCPPERSADSGTPCPEDGDECTADVCDGAGMCMHPDNNLCGACCNTLEGTCTDDLMQDECSGTQRVLTLGAACADVTCDAVRGACCDGDTFGSCTQTTQAGCNCGKCVWTKLATCAGVTCTHEAIPTVSHWGLVVLTLLLLTGAKVRFGRMQQS